MDILNIYREFDELELRTGIFNKNRFIPGISSYMYYLCMNHLSKGEYKISREIQEIYIYNEVAKAIKTIKNLIHPFDTISIEKTRKGNLDIPEKGIRVSLNKEVIVDTKQEYISNEKYKYRNRTRFTPIKDEKFIIELTMDVFEKNYEYSIELEFTKKPELNMLNTSINWLSDFVNYLGFFQEIAREYNRYFYEGSLKGKDSNIPFTGEIMPKNLKPEIVKEIASRQGTLYGDPKGVSRSPARSPLQYSIINKPNGVNFILYFSKYHKKAFLLNKTEGIVFIENHSFNDTAIFGEYLDKKFYAIDCLVHNGKNIMNLDYPKRYNFLTEFSKIIEIIPIFNTGNLYNDISTCFDYINKYWKKDKNDGVIFKPNNLPFNNSFTYKWKPEWENTIDFSVKRIGENTWNLFAYGQDNNIALFYGSKEYEINPNVYIKDSDMRDINKGEIPIDMSIIEFTYSVTENRFFPKRIRIDKIKPNFIGVSLSIWHDIFQPFTADKLLKLVGQENYKSIEKLTLFELTEKICQEIISGNTEILDILPYIKRGVRILDILRDCVKYSKNTNIENNSIKTLRGYFSN